ARVSGGIGAYASGKPPASIGSSKTCNRYSEAPNARAMVLANSSAASDVVLKSVGTRIRVMVDVMAASTIEGAGPMPVNVVILIWADVAGRHDPLGRSGILRGDTELTLRKRRRNRSWVARRPAAQGPD